MAPFMRATCLLINLVAPDAMDGYARFLEPCDLPKMTNKTMVNQAALPKRVVLPHLHLEERIL